MQYYSVSLCLSVAGKSLARCLPASQRGVPAAPRTNVHACVMLITTITYDSYQNIVFQVTVFVSAVHCRTFIIRLHKTSEKMRKMFIENSVSSPPVTFKHILYTDNIAISIFSLSISCMPIISPSPFLAKTYPVYR